MVDDDPVVLGDELMLAAAALRRHVRRELRPALGDPPLRGAQIELLHVVADQPGIGVAASARALHLAANSVSTLVNQLADVGMLERRTDPADRRAIRLHLTATAERRLTAWRTARAELVGAGIDRLTRADRLAIGAAVPALRALLVHLEPEERR